MAGQPRFFHTLPLDVWYHVRDFLDASDIENVLQTGGRLWDLLFKNTDWLDLFKEHQRCPPVILGRNLSAYRPWRHSNDIFVVLLASRYPEDLESRRAKFLASLRDGCLWDEETFEVRCPSGVIFNVYQALHGADHCPVYAEELMVQNEHGVSLEYVFHDSDGSTIAMKTLWAPHVHTLDHSTRQLAVRWSMPPTPHGMSSSSS